ncbi:MAG: hypothetical protein AAGA58_10635 [Verrucomicrobiota bacterium]
MMYIVDFEGNKSADPAFTLALDEVLFEGLEAPHIRKYHWGRNCVTAGILQNYSECLNFSESEGGSEVYRRMTGGGIAVHRRGEAGLSAVFPGGNDLAGLSPPDFYRRLHEAMASVLRRQGQEVTLAGAVGTAQTGACWGLPVESDLLVAGQKVCGGALRKTRRGILYQGMLNIEVPDDFAELVAGELGFEPSPLRLSKEQEVEAGRLAAEKYQNVDWTRRR